jgi:hypothetical protein
MSQSNPAMEALNKEEGILCWMKSDIVRDFAYFHYKTLEQLVNCHSF